MNQENKPCCELCRREPSPNGDEFTYCLQTDCTCHHPHSEERDDYNEDMERSHALFDTPHSLDAVVEQGVSYFRGEANKARARIALREACTTYAEAIRKEERGRIKDYLFEKSHAGLDQYGDEYERIVHWCYVETAINPNNT